MYTHIKHPLFITGHPRSGTTLMRLIINAHSEFVVPEETNIFYWYFKRNLINKILKPKISEDPVILNAFGKDICSEFEKLPRKTRNNPALGITFLFDRLKKIHNKKYWGDKTPLQTQFTDQIIDIYPNSFIIIMVRDPRAVVASSKRYFEKKRGSFDFWITNNIDESINRWKNEINISLEFKKKYPNQMKFVKYEELVSDPKKIIQSICEKTNISFELSMLDYHIDRRKETNKLEDWMKETSKPINEDNAFRWKKELSSREIDIINNSLKSEMDIFKYS